MCHLTEGFWEDVGRKEGSSAVIAQGARAGACAQLFSAHKAGSCRPHFLVSELEIGLAVTHFVVFE